MRKLIAPANGKICGLAERDADENGSESVPSAIVPRVAEVQACDESTIYSLAKEKLFNCRFLGYRSHSALRTRRKNPLDRETRLRFCIV